MFDFMQMLGFGKEVTAHGQKWQSVHECPGGYHLAVPLNAQVPCPVTLVKEDKPALTKVPAEEPK